MSKNRVEEKMQFPREDIILVESFDPKLRSSRANVRGKRNRGVGIIDG